MGTTLAGEAPDTSGAMGIFERWLSLWVGLAIATGILLGNLFPAVFATLAGIEYASVNLLVAALIWAMVYPMMVNVDFASLRHIGDRPKGLIITVVVNWLIKPFTMAALGVLYFEVLFAQYFSPEDAAQYIAGMILLGAAPCTAMVFVWSQLTRGDATYTLVQVSLNDVIMVFAFAPIVALLLGVTDITVPWSTLLLSVGLYVLAPLVAGAITRAALLRGETAADASTHPALERFGARVKPVSIIGLLATIVLLFGFQGELILGQPALIAILAVPLLVQSYGIFAVAFAAAWWWRLPYNVAAPCALIGTSNFFELAVAVAIGIFGLGSGAALVTVVGVLVEVPVMLSLVALGQSAATSLWLIPRRWRSCPATCQRGKADAGGCRGPDRFAGRCYCRQRRDRSRQHAAVAPATGSAPFQTHHDGQADHHGAANVRIDRPAAARTAQHCTHA